MYLGISLHAWNKNHLTNLRYPLFAGSQSSALGRLSATQCTLRGMFARKMLRVALSSPIHYYISLCELSEINTGAIGVPSVCHHSKMSQQIQHKGV